MRKYRFKIPLQNVNNTKINHTIWTHRASRSFHSIWITEWGRKKWVITRYDPSTSYAAKKLKHMYIPTNLLK